jgi:hypothetical protein
VKYQKRDTEAMAEEALAYKRDIAAELAYRDTQIAKLEADRKRALDTLKAAVLLAEVLQGGTEPTMLTTVFRQCIARIEGSETK